MIVENYNQEIESDALMKDFLSFVNELAEGINADIKFPCDEYQNFEHDILTVCHHFNQRYYRKLQSFPKATIEKINRYMNLIVKSYRHKDIHFDILSEVSHVIQMIEDSFNDYFKGFPSQSFECIETSMTADGFHLLELLPQFCESNNTFYRVRKESEEPFTKRLELYHVPFENRERCDTYRFSILGYPALYLASSLLTSLKECGFKNPENYYCSCYKSTRKLTFIDLSYSSKATSFTEKYSFIVFYPLIVACGQKVRKPDACFKPEYVIPQLVFQVIRHYSNISCIDGITYTSTKYDDVKFTDDSRRNFVMFITDSIKEKGYSEDLAEKLVSTKPQKCLSDIGLSEIISCTSHFDDVFSD